MSDTPTVTRPRFHVWLYPDGTEQADYDDTDPVYLTEVRVTNQDQLLAETQAKGLAVDTKQAFHLTNLWIWAACVRRGLTQEKFKPFSARLEYEPVKGQEDEDEDPTSTAGGANSG